MLNNLLGGIVKFVKESKAIDIPNHLARRFEENVSPLCLSFTVGQKDHVKQTFYLKFYAKDRPLIEREIRLLMK